MRAVIQRVKKGAVSIDEEVKGEIDKGLVVLLGVGENDDNSDVKYMVNKISGLRIFNDYEEKMNLSLKDIKGEVLLISQFTLYGDVRKGRRPSFIESAKPELAKKLYNETIEMFVEKGIKIKTGVFGADMDVSLVNDGPVTILLDSKKKF